MYRVSDPDPDWIRIHMGQRIRIRNPDPDPGRPKLFPKNGKNHEFLCLKSSLLGWRLLLEPECPLLGFKKTYRTVFDQKIKNVSCT
jgi:hypothetical protein